MHSSLLAGLVLLSSFWMLMPCLEEQQPSWDLRRKKKLDGVWVLEGVPRLLHQTWAAYSGLAVLIVNSYMLKLLPSQFLTEGILDAILYKYPTIYVPTDFFMYFPTTLFCFTLEIISQREGGIMGGIFVCFLLFFWLWMCLSFMA